MPHRLEDDQVLAAVENTEYAKECIAAHLRAMTIDQKHSLYRAIAKLTVIETESSQQAVPVDPRWLFDTVMIQPEDVKAKMLKELEAEKLSFTPVHKPIFTRNPAQEQPANDPERCRHGAPITEYCYLCHPEKARPVPAEHEDAVKCGDVAEVEPFLPHRDWHDDLPLSHPLRRDCEECGKQPHTKEYSAGTDVCHFCQGPMPCFCQLESEIPWQVVADMLIAYHGVKPHPGNRLEREMARAYTVAAKHFKQKQPKPLIRCIFCQADFCGVEFLMIHSADCPEHPAVKNLQQKLREQKEELLPKPEDDPNLDADLEIVIGSWDWTYMHNKRFDAKEVKQMIRDACCLYRGRLASRRTEQPQAAEVHGVDWCEPQDETQPYKWELCQHDILATNCPNCKPAPGDVVERIEKIIKSATTKNAVVIPREMMEILAVAREGYVKMEDVERAIREDDELSQWHSSHLEPLVKRVRFRLTPKPPERVTIRPVHGSGIGVFQDGLLACPQFFSLQQDAERYAAGLRKELEGKNG